MTDGYPFWLLAATGLIAFLLGRWSATAASRANLQQASDQRQHQPQRLSAMVQGAGGAGVDVDASGLDPAAKAEVIAFIRQDRKIEAIRLVKQKTGQGLKEAKDYVDELSKIVDRQVGR